MDTGDSDADEFREYTGEDIGEAERLVKSK
jgi:hypothetical protein